MKVYILGSTDGDSGLYIKAVYKDKKDAEKAKGTSPYAVIEEWELK